MGKEGKKLELYEILAAKRAKGKIPPGFDSKDIRPANSLEDDFPDPPPVEREETRRPGVIIDDAVAPEVERTFPAYAREAPESPRVRQERPVKRAVESVAEVRERPEARPVREVRPRSPREVVFALDTALLFFSVVVALVASSYFLGYKRGQEERPAGMVGDIERVDQTQVNLLNLEMPRSTVRPMEQDYTVLIRTEPAENGDLPERLQLELAEAVTKGRQQAGFDIQGFIFRSEGNLPQYCLAVGLGKTANDQELNRLFQIFTNMDGITLSRVPNPYKGSCRVAQVKELGVQVY